MIFSSGNGIAVVDDGWFEHATEREVLGVNVQVAPPEESIWSKSFVMERERYDGADVAHIILAHGERLDWRRLIDRFGAYWRVLLSHLVLFGFIYPSERSRVPAWVLEELMQRLSPRWTGPTPRSRSATAPSFRGRSTSGTCSAGASATPGSGPTAT